MHHTLKQPPRAHKLPMACMHARLAMALSADRQSQRGRLLTGCAVAALDGREELIHQLKVCVPVHAAVLAAHVDGVLGTDGGECRQIYFNYRRA